MNNQCQKGMNRRRMRNRKRRLQDQIDMSIGQIGSLCDLKMGQKAKVVSLHTKNPAFRRRLLDMGITKGAEVYIKKISPMGDPVDIVVRGYELCLRQSDMMGIAVEVIS